MIIHFRAQNFKALRDVSLELTQMHVLIGPNDSGKTSILEAIAAMGRFRVTSSATRIFVGDWHGNELVWQGNNALVTFNATVPTPGVPITCSVSIRFGVDDRSNEHVVNLFYSDGEFEEVVRREGRPGFNLRDEGDRRLDDDFLEGVWPIALFKWRPTYLAMPCATHRAREFTIDASGFGLAQVLDALTGFSPESFIELKHRFRSLFPAVRDIRLQGSPGYLATSDQAATTPDLEGPSEGKGIFFAFHGQPELLRAARVSDGLLFGLAMLTVLSVPEPPKIILLEEPENGIHPLLLKQVFGAMRELLKAHPDTQIIMTTHSPYVVDLMSPEEVTLCQKDPATGEVRATSLAKSPLVKEQLGLFTLGELWTMQDDDAKLLDPIPGVDVSEPAGKGVESGKGVE